VERKGKRLREATAYRYRAGFSEEWAKETLASQPTTPPRLHGFTHRAFLLLRGEIPCRNRTTRPKAAERATDSRARKPAGDDDKATAREAGGGITHADIGAAAEAAEHGRTHVPGSGRRLVAGGEGVDTDAPRFCSVRIRGALNRGRREEEGSGGKGRGEDGGGGI